MHEDDANMMAIVVADVLEILARNTKARISLDAAYEYGPYYRMSGDGFAGASQGRGLFVETLTNTIVRMSDDA